MDRSPLKFPLAAVTLCLPIVLLIARVGPGPLAARHAAAMAPATGSPPAERRAPETAGPPPAVQVLEMEPLVITGRRRPADDPAPGSPSSPEGQAKRGAPRRLTGKVNLNEAPRATLMLLPGLGPKRARAILAMRDRRPLRKIADVLRVRGIGRRSLRKWRGHLAVRGESTLRWASVDRSLEERSGARSADGINLR